MARRSQCSSAGDNPLDPNYLPPHYREEYRLAIDALVEEDLEGYYKFLQKADVVDFLCTPEIQYIQTSVEVPLQGQLPEQQFLDSDGEGSSDTYWPIHSDLDVPGLDLGWPQVHRFIGPTEVTTLVNPPETDMPSIKEQARRLIKNAQQVIAIVMDMFTDVDIFADILNAAMRSVAVYILLDEQNADHFLNMASNCRVDLQSIQFLRVRVVSGITYHCRSGKSFKGQMMDRFLLTDCRAVLSGNYSFMWSFEKLHRCMAHLFLGQLISTFDEEFRILYAQSEPLITENTVPHLEEVDVLQKTQYPSERLSLYREPRKILPPDIGLPDERLRRPYDDRMDMDWRMSHLKKQDPLQGPTDIYSRLPSQQPRVDLPYEQGPFRQSMLENPAYHKRHSYAEGVQRQMSFPFLQKQGMPEPEIQGRQFHRGQQPYPGLVPGPEANYSGYDKFWNQDFHSDQYSDPGFAQEMQPPDNFDHVYNFLSSSRNLDFDQSSEKLLPEPDVPLSSSLPKRLNISQSYPCQTSPTPSSTTDSKSAFQDPSADRKDPTVKRAQRNWRISSYLSAYDNSGEEGLPMAAPQAPEPFEEPSNPIQQTGPGMDVSFPKIPNVREFKIPAMPRASQLPPYTKNTVRELPKKLPDEVTAVAAEKITTPTPSESSSTAEGEKAEETELKEPTTAAFRTEEAFRRKLNAATPRSSRLRSSLIFSSLDQQNSTQDGRGSQEQEEEDGKNEAEQTKLPFLSQVLGQRRSTTREPFEWSRYIKSSTFDNSTSEASKPDDSKADNDPKIENLSDNTTKDQTQESLKSPDTTQSSLNPLSKAPEIEMPKMDLSGQAPISFLPTPPFVDMNDADNRLFFFKQLAAQRKAAKAAEAGQSKDKAPMIATDVKAATLKKEEPALSNTHCTTGEAGKTLSTEASQTSEVKQEGLLTNNVSASQSSTEEQSQIASDTEEKIKKDQTASVPVSEEIQTLSQKYLKGFKPAVRESCLSRLTLRNAIPAYTPSPEFTAYKSKNQKQRDVDKSNSTTSQNCAEEQMKMSTDSEKEQHSKQSSQESLKDLQLSKFTVKESTLSHPQTSTNPMPSNIPFSEPVTNESDLVKDGLSTPQSCQDEQIRGATDEEKELETRKLATSSSVSAETKPSSHEPLKDSVLSEPAANESRPSNPTTTNANQSNVPSPVPGKNDCENKISTDSEKEGQPTSSSVEAEPASCDPLKDLELPIPNVKDSSPGQHPASTNAPPAEKDANKIEILEQGSVVKDGVNNPQSCEEEQINVSNRSDKELETSQSTSSLLVSTNTEPPAHGPFEDIKLTEPAGKQSSPNQPPESTNATTTNIVSPKQGTGENKILCCQSTSMESSSQTPNSVEVPIIFATLDANVPKPELVPLEVEISELTPLSEKLAGSELNNQSSQSSSSNHNLTHPDLQIIPDHPTPSSATASEESLCSKVALDYSSSTIVSQDYNKTEASEPVDPSPHESSQAVETSTESISQFDSSQALSGVDSVSVESDISSDICTTQRESDALSLHSTTESNSEGPGGPKPSEHDQFVAESEIPRSFEDVKSNSTPFNLSPSSAKLSVADVSDEELCTVKPDEIKSSTVLSPTDLSQLQTCPSAISDIAADEPHSATNASPQDVETHVTPEINLTGSVTPTLTETESQSSPLTASDGSALSPEAEKTETNMSTSCSSPTILPKQITTHSNQSIELRSSELSLPTQPTSKILTEPEPTPESLTSESQCPESSESAENRNIDAQSEINEEPKIPETVSLSSSLTELDGSVLPPEAENMETNQSSSCSTSAPLPKQIATDSKESSVLPSIETSFPSEPTSNTPSEPALESVTSESHTPEPSEPDENGKIHQESEISREPELPSPGEEALEDTDGKNKVNNGMKMENTSNQVVPQSTQTKQPKASQSRYQSSTANVLSSSNLRDDTKLLLEQISANSQSRNEATKDSPVTDDEKEDKADKNAKRETDRGIGILSRAPPKSAPDKDKLLERIQSMRKERKVYSRFQMAP